MKWTGPIVLVVALTAPAGHAVHRVAAAPTPPPNCSVALVGDSLALGLLPPLVTALEGCRVEMHWNFGPLSPDTDRRLDPVLADPPDVAVVALGVWEQAHLRLGNGIDTSRAGWPGDYRRDHLGPWIDRLLDAGTEIVWLGMHRTRDEPQSARTAALNAIWADVADGEAAMTWVDGRATMAGANGRYLEVDSSVDPAVRVIGRDGIHVCREGAVRLTGAVVATLDRFGVRASPGWERAPWDGETLIYEEAKCPPPPQTRDSFSRFLNLALR